MCCDNFWINYEVLWFVLKYLYVIVKLLIYLIDRKGELKKLKYEVVRMLNLNSGGLGNNCLWYKVLVGRKIGCEMWNCGKKR